MTTPEVIYLLARVCTCGIWLGAAAYKITHFGGFLNKIREFGFPVPWLVASLVITIEVIGSLFVIFNHAVLEVALIWIAFTIWATWLEHRKLLDANGTIIFPEYVQIWKNVSIVGGLILLILLDLSKSELAV